MKTFFEVGKELQINQLKDDLTMKSDINDSVIEPDDNVDIRKKYSLTDQKLSKNSGVTDTDLNTYKSFTCEECKLEFKYKQSLVQHIRSKHEGVKYSCDTCELR